MKKNYGDEEGQYKMLWDYGNELRRSNPGTSFFVALDSKARFNKAYMCLDACKRGFLQGCRPMIFIDECHIKTKQRTAATAVGIDSNDCIFPIAIVGLVLHFNNNNFYWKDAIIWIYTNSCKQLTSVPCFYVAAIKKDHWPATQKQPSLASIQIHAQLFEPCIPIK